MSQSLTKLYIHLVFGTKYREPFIKPEWEDQLHAYMAGILQNMGCFVIKVNSATNHVHILFGMSKNLPLAKVVEQVKKNSSKWVKEIDPESQMFKWQGGYAAFSVNSHGVEIVKRYIENQKVHHKQTSFKEEVEDQVKEYDINEYDEKYFWD